MVFVLISIELKIKSTMANFRNPYQNTIELANNELREKNAMISLYEDEEGYYSVDIIYGLDFSDPANFDITKYELCETFAENLFENELDNTIIEAWHCALEKIEAWEKEAEKAANKEPKKMYAVIKNCNYDFNIDIDVVAVTDTKEKAKEILKSEIEKEERIQQNDGLEYNTIEKDEDSYEAYDDGYEATDSVRIYITEAPFVVS